MKTLPADISAKILKITEEHGSAFFIERTGEVLTPEEMNKLDCSR